MTSHALPSYLDPHHLGPFFIHSHGVEIIHFNIRIGTNRVGGWTGVFWKLCCAQLSHIFDPFDRTTV